MRRNTFSENRLTVEYNARVLGFDGSKANLIADTICPHPKFCGLTARRVGCPTNCFGSQWEYRLTTVQRDDFIDIQFFDCKDGALLLRLPRLPKMT